MDQVGPKTVQKGCIMFPLAIVSPLMNDFTPQFSFSLTFKVNCQPGVLRRIKLAYYVCALRSKTFFAAGSMWQ